MYAQGHNTVTPLYLGKTDMEFSNTRVASFEWEWGRNLAPRDGQKIPCIKNSPNFFCG